MADTPPASFALSRNSITAQVVAILRNRIDAGEWAELLPPERELCRQFNVCRNTFRLALAVLAQEGRISRRQGLGTQVLACPPQSASQTRAATNVALLFPRELGEQRPIHLLWINELRGRLFEDGVRCDIFNGSQYYRANPAKALEQLTKQFPHTCWVVCESNHATQKWFNQSGLPCVIAGSQQRDISLPAVDVDHRAVVRHAVTTLARLGHRRIVLLNRRGNLAGELASEAGLAEAQTSLREHQLEIQVRYHADTAESTSALVRRLALGPRRPTALIVCNPCCYLAAAGTLASLGLRIPEDVSLISRDDENFLHFSIPQPARYAFDAGQFAQRLHGQIRKALTEFRLPGSQIHLMPTFVKGRSIRSAPNDPGQ